MAVVYMKRLEEEPQTYEKSFTKLTKGLNQKAKSWIVDKITSNSKVMEVGCGTGNLSMQLAVKGCHVIALDQNGEMIKVANQKIGESQTRLFYSKFCLRFN
jgi:2-polyprenyl-3-methyl-5-hydroxy-6-metoxy-1,4-benzoquinol methylase